MEKQTTTKTVKSQEVKYLESTIKELLTKINKPAIDKLQNLNQHYKVDLKLFREYVTVSSIYPGYLIITPLLQVADQYRVPMYYKHAENYFNKVYGKKLDLSSFDENGNWTNFDGGFLIFKAPFAGKDLSISWFNKPNIKELLEHFEFTPISNVEFKELFNKNMDNYYGYPEMTYDGIASGKCDDLVTVLTKKEQK